MNWVDVLVLVLALVAATSGARQGMVTAIGSFAGVLAGAVLGVRFAPVLVSRLDDLAARIGIGVAIVVLLIALGETLGVSLGRIVRERLDGERIRQVESGLGAVVQGAAALAVAWLVALPLTSSSYTELANAIRRSAVLQGVDEVMPEALRSLPAELTRLLDVSGFPDVLAPFAATPIAEVPPADPALLNHPVVVQARDSVLKVRGRSDLCGRMTEGSSFVIAPQRVLTNAHVVAGTESVAVETADGELDAEVVAYDPATDVAVLEVPELDAPVLPLLLEDAPSGLDVLVLGYPMDGPYTPSAGRVRDQLPLRGPDIYGSSTVTREVYTVRAEVRSGNSGGPLVDTSGQVRGLVFGAAVDDDDTGFALTGSEIADDVGRASSLTEEVDTGSCAT
ncbi:MAG TPA: MarP family serine protease [Pseudonocardiaceae bacterium]|nr:MarP family serine protease [Pseudonocardiaceae bacterium]